MTHPLITPILIKDRDTLPWPADEPAFYVLTRQGLYLCRNHEFFRSCSRAPEFPRELQDQRPFLECRYPKIPRAAFERVVGFFSLVGEEHGAEAAVHLVWDRHTREIEIFVPEQTATVGRDWTGQPYPIGLKYTLPTDLPAHQVVVGDVHSHVDAAAYASGVDVHDESHQPGLHVVVGRITREPPEVHAEIVVDGSRFPVARGDVVADYERRSTRVPAKWLERVHVEDLSMRGSSDTWSSGDRSSGEWTSPEHEGEDLDHGHGRGDTYGEPPR